MMFDNDEDKFAEWLQHAAKTYHAPRPTPRDEMWTRIEAARIRRPPLDALDTCCGRGTAARYRHRPLDRATADRRTRRDAGGERRHQQPRHGLRGGRDAVPLRTETF